MNKKINYLLSYFFALSSLLLHAQQTTENNVPDRTADSILGIFETVSSSTFLGDLDRNYTDSIKINILHTLSTQYLSSNSENAYQCAMSALIIANRTKNKNLLSIANRKIGNFYFYESLYDQAVKYYLVSLKIAED
jgi:tetratricopeptide (TPR) repeat protein